jgi:hypothetical protein
VTTALGGSSVPFFVTACTKVCSSLYSHTHLNADSLWDVCYTSQCESSSRGSGSTCPQGQK